MKYQVILYYKFQKISNVDEFLKDHKKACRDFNLLGRIYISQEGINGTLGGKKEDIKRYQEYLHSLAGFEDVSFKADDCPYTPFVKLIVRFREEIVTLKTDEDIHPEKSAAPYLEPDEWRKMLESGEDYVLMDVRNNYESAIGHFEGAVLPEIENFYDFPQWLEMFDIDKNKKILMYCTGGIRCEKFSIYMMKKGFKDVNQLHGGIIRYAREQGGAHYRGKCFVFDDRLSVPVEENQKEPISKCEISGKPCDSYINCANMDCNRLFICSEEGAVEMQGCCSKECTTSKRRRPFNKEDIYCPSRKWYMYFDEKTDDGFSNRDELTERFKTP